MVQHVPPGTQDFSREFFIEKFITVNAQGNFQPEGPGGGKGEPGVPPKMVMDFYFPKGRAGVRGEPRIFLCFS